VALLNRGTAAANISFSFEDLPLAPLTPSAVLYASHYSSPSYDVLDLWADGHSVGSAKGGLSAAVGGTAAAFYKLVPTRAASL
jgi:hypothetical protein